MINVESIQNIVLLYGGVSGEHDVSCVSAEFVGRILSEAGYTLIPIYVDIKGGWHLQDQVYSKKKSNKKNPCFFQNNPGFRVVSEHESFPFDFVFPMIHGTTGEDGKLQGMLEFLQIPFAGADHMTSALCMDKWFSREIFSKVGMRQVKYLGIEKRDYAGQKTEILNRIKNDFQLPVFLKPCNMGSSVGISKVTGWETLDTAIQSAFMFDEHILCEQGIEVREIEFSILGNFADYEVSHPGEIISHHAFYSYEAKYLDANGATLEFPAKLDSEIILKMQGMARSAFAAVRGDGFARIDFFIDKNTREIYLNEINTLPGFTPISMFPKLWQISGLEPHALIHKIVQLGIERFNRKIPSKPANAKV